MPELRGRLLTGREAFRPSEPRHSPDKAMPSYYIKNEICKWNFQCVVCVFRFPMEGVFIRSWGSSTDLVEVVTHQVAADWPSHMVS
jgi:hypothetical protein